MKQRLFGSILLISGTGLGAGMLALPVATAPVGFLMSIALLVGVWMLMCFTGLLVVEANLWLPENTSYISMARKTLGRVGQIIAWVFFLFLLYALLTAYVMGGGSMVMAVEELYLRHSVQPWISYLPWIVTFAVIVYYGIHLSDLLNRLLILGLIISFAVLSAGIAPNVHVSLLDKVHYPYLFVALPVIFAAFGYHIIVPSIRDYLHSRTHYIRWAVLLGTFIPLCLYVFWDLLVFGTVPMHGSQGLLAILKSAHPTNLLVIAISNVTHHSWLDTATRFFVFFAIASSFVGVSLGLFDFLADGLKINKQTKQGRIILACLTFGPPLVFALIYPQGFIAALGFAGVFVAILHGILPAMMVWSGRYILKSAQGYRVWGGRILLLMVVFLSLLVIISQCGIYFNWFPQAWFGL